MELLLTAIDVVLNLNRYLAGWVTEYGPWIYAILFLVIFAETGLIVTPFLPGDSLLFIAGALAAAGGMDVHLLVVLLIIAAILGDAVNYRVGAWLGPSLFKDNDARYLKREYLDKAHDFYEKWGGLAIILARFTPFLRTYVPFVAGMSRMTYAKFATYNVVGGILWVASLTYLGYFFGNIPWVKANQGLVVIGIVILSLLPAIYGLIRSRSGNSSGD
jgi:membrane-associated protein